jgi:foldase protein PrsA
MSKRTKQSTSPKKDFAKVEPEVIEPMSFESPSKPLLSVRNIIFIIILLAALAVWKFKGMIIAAWVNGQPVTRMELNDVMLKRYGQQTLDGIINERLILQAIQNKGIKVSDAEINDKVKEIEDKLKGTISLKDALAAQGMTEETFKKQMEVQIAVDKYFDKDASVSSKEIEDYI